MGEWQPIEDWDRIPTNEQGVTERVLLGFPEGGEYRVIVGYRDPYYMPGGRGHQEVNTGWVVDSGETLELYSSTSPTHWMPLPAPPGTETGIPILRLKDPSDT